MNQQSDILFDPIKHTYLRKGKFYTSCTTITSEFKKPFNRRYWAMYSTLKEKFGCHVVQNEDFDMIQVNGHMQSVDVLYSVEMYRDGCKMMKIGWDDITKTACSRGNKIHDYLEDSINDSKKDGGKSDYAVKPFTGENTVTYNTLHDLNKTNLQEVYPEIHATLLYYIEMGCTIYAEKKVYIDEYEVSGMIDCLVVKGNKFLIIDWKTNKDIIHFESGYYRKEKINGRHIKTKQWIKKSKPLLTPLAHLEECKGNLYTLQVSLYAYMFESWGYELIDNGLMIYHMRPNERPKLIKVPYLKEDIILMLDYHKENLAA